MKTHYLSFHPERCDTPVFSSRALKPEPAQFSDAAQHTNCLMLLVLNTETFEVISVLLSDGQAFCERLFTGSLSCSTPQSSSSVFHTFLPIWHHISVYVVVNSWRWKYLKRFCMESIFVRNIWIPVKGKTTRLLFAFFLFYSIWL